MLDAPPEAPSVFRSTRGLRLAQGHTAVMEKEERQPGPHGGYHEGYCCGSCRAEYEEYAFGGEPQGVIIDGWCCCKDERNPSWSG